jgi:hypothetical protein
MFRATFPSTDQEIFSNILSARGERLCRPSAEKGDQLAPFQLIELHALLLAKGHRITD